MADVKLPVVEAHLSPNQALDVMRARKRSGIVIQIGKDHLLIRASQLAEAIELKVERVEQIPGLRRLVPTTHGLKNVPLRLLDVDETGATLLIREHWLPMFESSPQICKCDNGHDGWPDGAKCTEKGCTETVHCTKL